MLPVEHWEGNDLTIVEAEPGGGGGVLLALEKKKLYFVNVPPKSLSFVKVLERADWQFQLKNAFAYYL